MAGNYGLGEATQGITKLDLREQELLDMEVARKLQEEEVKASKMDKRAAQVAQDEVSGRPAASLSGTVVTDRLAFSRSLSFSLTLLPCLSSLNF
ncbi:Coiled-coil domain-containing protein 50 [Salmo salar]|uniref:Coiled-coil domain-containing protein 50 n=1 Tax=Salmo salar TaxID=8030 RepID=B9EM08_SALSA|nr:Coiled-coil domain-containing protein 50 [Salmo salar]ACM08555.1 Coiled-coil domain-containing protein 50 [Salmo salar]|eukprot:NP_001139896.1 Coiled-coil domain-containing protein 50 [Salmo salar]